MSAVLVIEEELRRITGRPDVTLDPQQVELIEEMAEGKWRSLVVCGGPNLA